MTWPVIETGISQWKERMEKKRQEVPVKGLHSPLKTAHCHNPEDHKVNLIAVKISNSLSYYWYSNMKISSSYYFLNNFVGYLKMLSVTTLQNVE
jgi:hypothetical protein